MMCFSITSKQWLAFKNIQKKKNVKTKSNLASRGVTSAKSRWEHLWWKNAAALLRCTAHVAHPSENVSKHKAVFLVPGLSQPAGATHRPKKRWLKLCLHILCLFCSWWVSHFPKDCFKHPYLFLNLGVKTRWGKKCARSVLGLRAWDTHDFK